MCMLLWRKSMLKPGSPLEKNDSESFPPKSLASQEKVT